MPECLSYCQTKCGTGELWGMYRIMVHLCCGASAGQHVSSLLAAALLSVLLFGPQPVVSDSDELVLNEWEVWKSRHGVNYDENVRCVPTPDTCYGNI